MTQSLTHPNARKPQRPALPDAALIDVIDLFCGAGGLSCGLKKAGLRVVGGIDVDAACKYPYEANHPGAKFLLQDVSTLTGADLEALWSSTSVRLLAGCAPCQPFSSYANTKVAAENDKWGLLYQFGRLVAETKPDLVTMENVPGVAAQAPFKAFVCTLKALGYNIDYAVLNAADYGAPQQRKRLVLLASLLGPVQLPAATHPGSARWVTVRDAVGTLPAIGDGEVSTQDPLHRASALSALNQQRVRASKPGGTWRDWPADLVAECHRKASGRHSAGVYGRMEWDKPAPTMTTLCIGYGNGRFGHPQQHRGITLREAAIFQSFPLNYKFVKPGSPVLAKPLARLIGNAVPPKLGEAVGRALQAALRSPVGTNRA